MIRAKVFNRDTRECEVIFREGDDYEILAERECWGPTIARWERGGTTFMEFDDDARGRGSHGQRIDRPPGGLPADSLGEFLHR